jgi:hypothetical protein
VSRTAIAAVFVMVLAGTRVATAPADVSATAPIPNLHVALFGPPMVVVIDAVRGAIRRVSTPRCQAVFTDFTDAAGRPLAANLSASAKTAGEYLAELRFADGSSMRACEAEQVVAATEPGSHVVFICGSRFEREFRAQRDAGEIMIVHELLHSLGLGENPPSSRDITASVAARCGN